MNPHTQRRGCLKLLSKQDTESSVDTPDVAIGFFL